MIMNGLQGIKDKCKIKRYKIQNKNICTLNVLPLAGTKVNQ